MSTEKKFQGYCHEDTLPIKRGDKVRIKKGTTIKRVGQEPTTVKRTYTVKVHHVLPGMSNPICDPLHPDAVKGYRYEPVHNPSVVWPGSGGYWAECDMNDVEKVS